MIMKTDDKTRKPSTEKAHAAMEQALRNAELRYRRLFESAQDGLLILNAETGQISEVNSSLLDTLGYSRAELVEKKLGEVDAFEDFEARRDSFPDLEKKASVHYKNLKLKTKKIGRASCRERV